MKVQIEKEQLLSLISRAQNIVEKRNTMPVLVNVLLDGEENNLKIFATNLEVSLTDHAMAETKEFGKVAVNAKSLFDIVKELTDGAILLEKQENNWLKITQNKSVFNIVGISPDEYPVFPTYATKDFVTFDAKVLSEMIEKTIYSVSNDETRYHLNGVFFEKLQDSSTLQYRMVATDGHRLSLIDVPSENKKSSGNTGVIIPRKGLAEIRKVLDSVDGNFEMAIEGAQLIVKHESTVLMIRLIEGKYPNYKQLIPQNLSKVVKVDRELLLSSLKRVSLLSNQKSKGVTLCLTQGKLKITSNNPELGDAKEELDVDYSGDDLKIGFNAKYILDVLSSIEDTNVNINLKDQLSPGIMRPEGADNYTCVIMPMRI